MAENIPTTILPTEFESAKASLLETFSQLKKWREEQVEQFRNMQRLDNQRVIRLSDENQRHLQRVLERTAKSPETPVINEIRNVTQNTSSPSEKSDCTLQESSITGHMQRCFGDSPQSNISAGSDLIKFDSIEAKKWATGFTGSQSAQSDATSKNSDKDLVQDSGINKDAVNFSSKPKRAFLRKGTGMLGYMSKSAYKRSTVNANKKKTDLPQKHMILKPAIRNFKLFEHIPAPLAENAKKIRFQLPNVELSEPTTGTSTESVRNSNKPSGDNSHKSIDVSDIESSNLSKENKELEEFELLETCTQNSSFNSDSSIVQKVLHGGNIKDIVTQKKNPTVPPPIINGTIKDSAKTPDDHPISCAKSGLNKYMEEVQARKQVLQNVIEDINPRIQALEKEIHNFNDESFNDSDVSERCSTPLEDLNVNERISSPVIAENESSIQFPEFPVPSMMNSGERCESACKSCNVNDVLNDLYPNGHNLEEQPSICESTDLPPEDNSINCDRAKIREKIQELDNEIQIYKEHNAKLKRTGKERDEIVKKLQKERDDFNKFKEAEKSKLMAEVEQERKQIRRQKETFNRFQKLRKDNPTRKEREELNALRQEVEKLQEELKRQRIKYTNDCRRWKNQLDAAEKERDSFKLENLRLEDQVQDLLTALKTRIQKNPPLKLSQNIPEEIENELESPPEDHVLQGSSTSVKQTETDPSTKLNKVTSAFTTSRKNKSKVSFDLKDEGADKNIEETQTITIDNAVPFAEKIIENGAFSKMSEDVVGAKDSSESQSFEQIVSEDHNEQLNSQMKNDFLSKNISNITVSIEADFREIDHGNKIERIYATGEREIHFNSGTRKIISADGKMTKFIFYNGDIKEVFSDKREIYRFVAGVVEKRFPDGLEVIEFPNGQIQRQYPDGQKDVIFPDGTTHILYADGAEEIRSTQGNVINISTDGTETIEFNNGQREIRTATYKRREFPDGSVKIIYDSGRQETRYSNGRIRIKDKEGKIVVDTKYLGTSTD